MPKGITPIISVILLLLITISIVGFAMIFMQRSAASTAEESEQQLAKQTSSLGENFEIININGNQVTVRNKGTAELKNLAFYVDGNPVTIKDSTTGSAIPKDGIGTFTLDAAQLAQYQGKKLKVSSSGLTKEENADFYSENTVAYWKFDEGAGRTGDKIKDYSGNGNDGTINTGNEVWNDGTLTDADYRNADGDTPPKAAAGKYGSAMQFDGTDDYVSVPNSAGLAITGAITVEAWIKTESTGSGQTILMRNGPYIFLIDGNNKLVFKVWTGAWSPDITGAAVLSTGRWYHVAATYDLSYLRLYVDGNPDGTPVPRTGAMSPGAATIFIGANSVGASQPPDKNWFNGLIDEVRIYNKALSPQEITEDMNSAYPVTRPVASYSFEKIVDNKAWDTHNVVKGKYGAAISFDGVDDRSVIGDNAVLRPAGRISLAAWVKPNAVHSGVILEKHQVTGGYGLQSTSSGKFKFYITPAQTELDSSVSYEAGKWYHVEATFDNDLASNEMKIYVNGVFDKEISRSDDLGTSTQTLSFGSVNDGSGAAFFSGAIDEVRILNTAIG